MNELLYLVHRIPYPPNKGDKIRSYHLLKHLAQSYTVHVGAFVDTDEDWQHADALTKIAGGEVKLLGLNPRWARVKSAYGLFSGEPLSLPYYRNTQLQDWVNRLLTERPITRALAFSSGMAQYLMPHAQLRRVIDFVDIDSDKWRQYADKKTWPMRGIYRREARTLFDYERSTTQAFNASTFVSAAEAALFKQLAPACAHKVYSYSNGVDTDYFSPTLNFPSPYTAQEVVLVFTGAMDYWPNVDAVTWFAHEVWSSLRRRHPAARFYIVGNRPTPAVQALGQLPGIVVTGNVPDTRPYIAHATLALAPLRIARGIQNKVLEAMAMAKPTLVTAQALEGIDAVAGQEILVANDADAFVQHVDDIIAQRHPQLGTAARQRVLQDFSWPQHLRIVDQLLDPEVPRETRRTPQALTNLN